MSESTPSDPNLWELARAGVESARTELAARAHRVALDELRRRRAPASDLDDLAQEVARSTFAFLERGGEAPTELTSFLKYRAWGVLSDARKRMRTQLPLVNADAMAERSDERSGPESEAERRQLLAAVRECQSKLPPDQRETLALRFGEQMESDAIASRLNVHRNTVYVRVFRALQSLRECLARKGLSSAESAE